MDIKEYSRRVYQDLSRNILQFWSGPALDNENGGYWGKMTFDGHPLTQAPKSLVLNSRILWAFSSICLYEKKDVFFQFAERAYDYILKYFIDEKYGGAFWMLNYKGAPYDTRKEVYGQAVLIHALVTYYKVCQDSKVLNLAEALFTLLESKCADHVRGGYWESLKRDWSGLCESNIYDGFLSEKKTLFTNIQILEAYTGFCQVWKDGTLFYRLKEMMDIFFKHMLNADKTHFHLLFDRKWKAVSDKISYGHDLWLSWIWCDAARVLGNKDVIVEIEKIAVKITDACLAQALDSDYGVFYQGNSRGVTDSDKHGWVQAEAVNGFLNAFSITKDLKYYEASVNSWMFIEKHIIDKKYGEWHWKLGHDLEPLQTAPKISTWKSPFYNTRVCIETIRKLYYIQSLSIEKKQNQ